MILAAMIPSAGLAQLFPVEPIEKGFFNSSGPTMTFLYAAQNAKATLVFVPGGDGSVGVKPDWGASHRYFSSYHYNRMLQSLSDPSRTSGQVSVVIFDSPTSLGGSGWPSARGTSDHLARIESVVLFYKEMLKKPVWVMGHSNGGISITEFYKHLRKSGKESLVAGLIYSGGRDGASFGDDTAVPVLLIHHENDGCNLATPANTQRLFNKLKEAGNSSAELVLIKSGAAEPGNVCHSGYHMYFGAGEEVARALDRFLARHVN